MATAEILSIGTELLLGHVLDTNSQFLAQELAALGINCFFRSTVGDNKARIKSSIRMALQRSDIVVTSGGLGPTADDLTTECLAEIFNVPLDFDQAILDRISNFFKSAGYEMPANNRKQALHPQGANILPNNTGTAPGIIWRLDQSLLATHGLSPAPKYILTFPGVPSELKSMWQETARPFLEKTILNQTIWSCQLKHYGIGESALAEKYAHLLNLSNPTVAPYAGSGECRLTVTALAENEQKAKAIAQPVIDEIVQTSGSLCYGFDEDTLESVLGKLLTAKQKSVAIAESCTGGLVSKRLTDIPGSSNYVKLNVVTYSNDAKMGLLNVPENILREYGAVSEQCAKAMAQGIMKLANTDIGLSVTGIAGPDGGTADKPVGLVYLGLASASQSHSLRLTLPPHLSRLDIRQRTASAAINAIRLLLLKAADMISNWSR